MYPGKLAKLKMSETDDRARLSFYKKITAGYEREGTRQTVGQEKEGRGKERLECPALVAPRN